MKILILEDELRVANQLRKMVTSILGAHTISIYQFSELDEAQDFLANNQIDLLFLDLNLHGEDGFEILKHVSAESFATIITSAHKEKAIQAFDYGVLDFVAKPFELSRLQKALSRLDEKQLASNPAKYLVVKKSLSNRIIPIEEVYYLEAQAHHTLLGLANNERETHHKSLNKLLQLLPPNFERIHKSYAVNKHLMEEINLYAGNKHELILKNGAAIPIGRKYYPAFKLYFV